MGARLFIAIEVPGEVARRILQTQAKLAHTRADVRWVDAGNFHLTVKFLGQTPENLIGEVSERMHRAAAQVPAFELVVEGIDRLPPRGPARVIVAPIHSPDQRLTKLHRLIDSAIGGMGLPMDTRVLTPHVTLGRVKSNHGVNRLLRLMLKHAWDSFGCFFTQRVSLMESLPGKGKDGASIYRVISSGELVPASQTPD